MTGDGDLALQAMVREPGEEERGEGDNTASSAYAGEGREVKNIMREHHTLDILFLPKMCT